MLGIMIHAAMLAAVLMAPQSPVTQQGQQTAMKFDEFSDIYESDLKARLDNFANMLQSTPDAKGFVVVYRSRRDLPGLSHNLAWRSRGYLLSTRGLTKDQIVIVDGGAANCLTQELWIVPKNTAPVPRNDAKIGHFYYPDVAWKFFEFSFVPPERYKRFGIKESPDEEADYLEAYADAIKKRRSNIAAVIAYAQYSQNPRMVDYSGSYEPSTDVRLDIAGTARRKLLQIKSVLAKTYGIPASRIQTIDGGYRKVRSVELWIVPAGEASPIATPNSFPNGRRKN